MDFFANPWPWYIGGPLIGLTVPIVYLYSGRRWGVSSTFRDVCAMIGTKGPEYFRYDWRANGSWRLVMVSGLVLGGALASWVATPAVDISAATRADLATMGITDFGGLAPVELFSWSALASPAGVILIVLGGFLVGFGTRYAGGCTSGHAISGLSSLRAASLAATVGFFVGGLISAHLLLPLVLGGGS